MDHVRRADTSTDEYVQAVTPACPRCAAIGRRTVLLGGAAGVAGLLAACGGDDPAANGGADTPRAQPGTGTSAGPSGPASPPATEPSPTASSGTPTPAQTAPGSGAEALTTTGEVPVGGGVVLDSPGVVVTQPSAGQYVAFSSTCTHQGCSVTDVADGLIMCPCHGSQYSVTDGSVQRGPAEQPLPPVPITVSGEQILPG